MALIPQSPEDYKHNKIKDYHRIWFPRWLLINKIISAEDWRNWNIAEEKYIEDYDIYVQCMENIPEYAEKQEPQEPNSKFRTQANFDKYIDCISCPESSLLLQIFAAFEFAKLDVQNKLETYKLRHGSLKGMQEKYADIIDKREIEHCIYTSFVGNNIGKINDPDFIKYLLNDPNFIITFAPTEIITYKNQPIVICDEKEYICFKDAFMLFLVLEYLKNPDVEKNHNNIELKGKIPEKEIIELYEDLLEADCIEPDIKSFKFWFGIGDKSKDIKYLKWKKEKKLLAYFVHKVREIYQIKKGMSKNYLLNPFEVMFQMEGLQDGINEIKNKLIQPREANLIDNLF